LTAFARFFWIVLRRWIAVLLWKTLWKQQVGDNLDSGQGAVLIERPTLD
jgi:hypothetical protein